MPQLPERCLSRKAGIVRCCPRCLNNKSAGQDVPARRHCRGFDLPTL
ncbi:MAG: hypothetical protein ACLUZX_08575 [Subdoligranulum sp.]